jgi:hypothetical protein
MEMEVTERSRVDIDSFFSLFRKQALGGLIPSLDNDADEERTICITPNK